MMADHPPTDSDLPGPPSTDISAGRALPLSLPVTLGLAAVFLLSMGPVISLDVWWHMAVGRWIIENAAFPRTDFFSHTANGLPWSATEWLSGIVFYSAYQAAGLLGIRLVRSCLITAIVGLAYRASRERGGGRLWSVLAPITVLFWRPDLRIERTYLFTVLFFMAVLVILSRTRKNGRRGREIFLLPVLVLINANLHPGALLAAGAVIVEAMVSRVRGEEGSGRMAAAGLLSAAALLFTPYGTEILTLPFAHTIWKEGYVLEWNAPTTLSIIAVLLPAAALIVSHLLGEKRGLKRTCPADITLLLLLLPPALLVARYQKYALLLLAVLLPAALERLLRREAVYSAALIAILSSLIVSPWASELKGVFRDFELVRSNYMENRPSRLRFPVDSAEYLAGNGGGGRLFNIYEDGGYLMWRLWPAGLDFVDGRAFPFGDGIYADYLTISRGEDGWKDALDRYDVETVVIPRMWEGGRLGRILIASPEWEEVHEDMRNFVFRRR